MNRVPTEHQEQKAVIQWFDRQHKAIRGRLFAVPNGGDRHEIVAAKLKAEGVRKGVPDLWLPVPRRGFHGLVIEMKRLKGSTTKPEQLDWLEFLGEQGYLVAVCKGSQAAIDTIQAYLAEGE